MESDNDHFSVLFFTLMHKANGRFNFQVRFYKFNLPLYECIGG